MQDPDLVCRVNSIRNLAKQTHCSFNRQSSLTPEQFVQSLALDIFHDEIENAFVALTEVGYADCVRVLDRRGGLSFPFESDDRLAFLQIVTVQNVLAHRFDRHPSV